MNVPGIARLVGLGVNAVVAYILLALAIVLAIALISLPIRGIIWIVEKLSHSKAGMVVIVLMAVLLTGLLMYGIARLIKYLR